jgi:hypothetical protein
LQPYPHEYTAVPSGWLRKAVWAVKLNAVPVIPGAEACAATAGRNTPIAAKRNLAREFGLVVSVEIMCFS